ncbi:MAG: photosystem I reaction center subunit IV [Gammaproteobacteria bacterium HGW-Gammaproteobacteria-9]|uniref:WD40/YVTN/BNR-like repeat-containing protein n=1 Tax=Pseudomonas sp. NPDC077186 TaxID=3364421 RepID=UPI000CCB2485|nr:MAG: photosystem I reaction center subunit IV [Gammaproteobacteria bacterium HGW-Gammaproteobacteria-9]
MIFFSSYFKRTWMLAVLLAATGASAQDRTFIDPLLLPARLSDRPAEKLLVDVAALGDGRLVAVGEQGTIILSDDKGHGWRQAEVPVSVNLTAVFFFDTRTGWAAGHGGVILGTRDGGQTWIRLFDGNAANAQILAAAQSRLKKVRERAQGMDEAADSLQDELELAEEALADAEAGSRFGPSRPLFDLWFKDARQGFVVGSFGQLFRTDDGGDTWRYIGDRLDNPEGFHYNAIAHTPSGKLAVVGEGGAVHISADGGDSWQRRETGYNGQLYGLLAFHDARGDEILLVYGFGGRVFVSRDGGASWAEGNSGVKTNIVAGFVAADGSLRLIDAGGQLLRSDDEGVRFVSVIAATPGRIAAAIPLTDGSLVLTGSGGVQLVTGNGK